MEPISFLRRVALGSLGTVLGTAMLVALAHGSEVSASSASHGLVLHGPEETLRDYCIRQNDHLWLVIPGATRCELVTSTADAAVANPGDGSFHPFEETEVRAALGALRCAIGDASADVFLLPYPRRGGLESAAGPGLILLSPGVRPLSPEHQHAEFVHELGHVIQYARMPDVDVDAWKHYRQLRGIGDQSVYDAGAAHANRPHEIFAEDFRALCGGALAGYSGTIENPSLASPASVPGLADFMFDLASGVPSQAGGTLACFPNPSSGAVSFSRSNALVVPLELFDLRGRRVATLQPLALGGVTTWRWDGRDPGGSNVGAGVFFARARGENRALRVTRVR